MKTYYKPDLEYQIKMYHSIKESLEFILTVQPGEVGTFLALNNVNAALVSLYELQTMHSFQEFSKFEELTKKTA